MRRRVGERRAASGLLAVLLLGGAWNEARSEDLIGYVEVFAADVSETDAFTGLPSVSTDTRQLARRLNFTWTRQLWPRLSLWAGGTFDQGDTRTTVDAFATDSTVTQVRPFVGVRRSGEKHNAQILWNRDQRTTESALFQPLELTRDGLLAAYWWNPTRGPDTRVTYTHNTEQDDLGTRDLESTLLDLSLVQRWNDRFRASYRGTYNGQDDAVVRAESSIVSHRADVQYDDMWLADRVWFHSEYAATRRDTTLTAASTGELVEPLFAEEGLFERDTTPLDGQLANLDALVNEDTVTATAIDLGLPGLTEDTTPWSLGVGFGERMAFDALDVYVDRIIERPSVIQAFTWRLYLSEDNQTWTPSQILTAPRFDGFQRRFELRFPSVTASYAKLVVAPLAPSVAFADEYTDLFVTELSAGRRLTVPGSRLDTTDTTQTLTVDARARLLQNRAFFYEGSYRATDSSRTDVRWRASNGLSFIQPFAEVWTVSARAAHEQERQGPADRTALVYGSSLAVSPVPRLRWTVALSGRQDENEEGLSTEQNSVFLYGAAGLYEGVDVQVGVGRSYLTDVFGSTTVADQIDLSATVVPRHDLSLGLIYTDSSSERVSGDVLGLFDLFTRTAEVNAAWTPFPTTYLYGAYRLEWRSELARDEVTDLVLSWAPFPLGALRMSFTYNQIQRTLLDQDETSYGPTLRWNLNPRSFVQLSYRAFRDSSVIQRLDSDVVAATLRLGF